MVVKFRSACQNANHFASGELNSRLRYMTDVRENNLDAPNSAAGHAIAARIRTAILEPLKLDFVGKDEVIDLLGVCLVSGENLFLLGPPGTAKSAIVRGLAARLEGKYFDYLLTRFTEPSELFGPFDIRRLREGELLTNTEGMLPEGEIVFLDELLNANSAILNSLLMALNERVFRRGRETRDLGFVLTVGASNRLPEDEALTALFDRFLLRVQSNNVPDEQLANVLQAGWQLQAREQSGQTPERVVSVEEVRELQRHITKVNVEPTRDAYVRLIHRLRHSGIDISDRRAVRIQRLVAASALMCGRDFTHVSDLWVLRYIWDTLEQVEILASIVDEVVGKRTAGQVTTGNDSLHNDATVEVHPRSSGADAPKAEDLARDLEQLAHEISAAADDRAKRSWISDRLSVLASRVEWVANDESRNFLRDRIHQLLALVNSADAAP